MKQRMVKLKLNLQEDINMQNLGLFLAGEVASAIRKGCKVATIEVGDDVHTFINLPEPQKSGTDYQQATYAKQVAFRLVREKGFNV